MERKQLTRAGRLHLFELVNSSPKPLSKYRDTQVITVRPCACWLIESDLGERKLWVTDATMLIEQIVDILNTMGWRVHFTVQMIDAGMFDLHPGGNCNSTDSRKVNERCEVVQ